MDMEDLPSDIEAKVIRFICGAVFGFLSSLITFNLLFTIRLDSPDIVWLLVGIATFLSGLWAMKYGDYFWKNIVNRWWFW
ncbi:MAG: hypothetical protein ACPF9K_04450 [Neptuniibacter sp.]